MTNMTKQERIDFHILWYIIILCCLLFNSIYSEDKNALNKLCEAVKTNFNDRYDEVKIIAINVEFNLHVVVMCKIIYFDCQRHSDV